MTAEEESEKYVESHGFDEEIKDTCKACYHDGYSDGVAQALSIIEQAVGEVRQNYQGSKQVNPKILTNRILSRIKTETGGE